MFFGWPMVGAGALIFFASGPGQSHTFGVFLVYLTEDLGLSHTEVSFAYGVATLAAAFGLPFAGRRIIRLRCGGGDVPVRQNRFQGTDCARKRPPVRYPRGPTDGRAISRGEGTP